MTATEDLKQTNYRNIHRELNKVLSDNNEAILMKLGNWIVATDGAGADKAKAIGAKAVKVIKWGETFRYRDFLKL